MKFKCEHCRLKFDETQLIEENGHKFCCNGCKQVFFLLQDAGLGEFYSKLGANTLNPVNSAQKPQNSDNIYKNYVKKTADGFNEIFVVIEGIHCSACVWLNERVLSNAKGVIEAAINGTTNKAKIVWDESEISLSEIFELIRSIGYEPFPYDKNRSEERNNARRRDFYTKLLVGLFATMNIMWIAIALYGGYFSGIDAKTKDIMHFAEFVLATPVLFFTGSEFFAGAKRAIKTRAPNMELLVCAGATLTYFYSVYAMFARSGETYFESVCMIITFVFIGKYLEVLTRKRASDTLDSLSNFILNDIQVKNGEIYEFKNPKDVQISDIILVNSGEKVLIDGVVRAGEGSFDYSGISGESLPVLREKGDKISSGAVCIDGKIEYEASSDFENSFLNKIINLLENASLKKPNIEKIANQISGRFSLTILLIALAVFAFWAFRTDFERALVVAVSVVVIACPCALGLATPVATLVGLGVGLKNKIIFKEAKIIETLAKCDCVVFDKTGTLTKSNLKVVKSEKFAEFDENLLLNLLKSSNHIVSRAVFDACGGEFKALNLQNLKNIQAKGVEARFCGQILRGGSAKFMQENGIKCENSEFTHYFFAIDDQICAKFELEDELKFDAKPCIDAIKSMKMEVFLLSGDNENVTKKIANELGIAEFRANFLPDEKAKFIENLRAQGKKIIMIGDGINDSVALSVADVGVSMGSGADVSVNKSDVVLLGDDLNSLLLALKISKTTLKSVKENLAFSLIYNAVTIPFAAAGFVIPLFAALSMSLSSVIVVLNSLRIRTKFKGKI